MGKAMAEEHYKAITSGRRKTKACAKLRLSTKQLKTTAAEAIR